MATMVPDLGKDEFIRRLLENFPRDWAGDQARTKGGALYALFSALSSQLDHLTKQTIYAQKTTRVDLAIDDALDAVGLDYFGNRLERSQGESDTSYRQRIKAQLLAPAQTVAAIKRALFLLTGFEPDVREPWNPVGAAYFDANTYFDVDVKDAPGKYSDAALRFQIFIDATLPGYSANVGGNPLYGVDAFFAFDTPQCALWTPQASWFITRKKADQLIVHTKPAGVKAWRRYKIA